MIIIISTKTNKLLKKIISAKLNLVKAEFGTNFMLSKICQKNTVPFEKLNCFYMYIAAKLQFKLDLLF